MKLKSIKKEKMHTLSSKSSSSSSSETLLPHDVIIEILLRLPAKAVSRFKYVCKDWFRLTSEPEFIKKHLQRHSTNHGKNNPSSLLIISRFVDPSRFQLTFLQRLVLSVLKIYGNISIHSVDYNFIDDDDTSRVVKIQNIPPSIKWAESGFNCLGSCNGLLAGICERDVICVWNPCIGEYREIIPPKQPDVLYDTTTTMWRMHDKAYGFGYDPITCDYKVLANTCYVSVTNGTDVYHWKIVANVYTLGTNSWRNIGEYPYKLNCKNFKAAGGLLIGGALYWIAVNSVSSLDIIIICFDLSDEVYREIPIPRCISHHPGRNGPMSRCVRLELREFKGYLSILRTHCFETTAEVWVMRMTKVDSMNVKEEGVGSWSKLFTISDIAQLEEAYRYNEYMWLEPGICKDGGFLMLKQWNNLYLYNPTDDMKTRRILADTRGEFGFSVFMSVLSYTESLASVNPPNSCLSTGQEEEKEEQEQEQDEGIKVPIEKSKIWRFIDYFLDANAKVAGHFI